MTKRMLIDATHAEETRVVVVDGNRLEELDFEFASKKHIKGNIYLAKVTRVEPSLQAAFVEYGGNRHGFLPFSEIHPDYYRIPVADREALIAEEERLAQQAEAAREAREAKLAASGDGIAEDAQAEANGEAYDGHPEGEEAEGEGDNSADGEARETRSAENGQADGADEDVETVGGDDVDEGLRRRVRPLRDYKIQEVIKRRQILLVQVTKEERGNKGAALTTYLSLAGRYCVLMPNTPRGGGVSRKITNPKDRKRLKEMLSDLDLPEGMAVILRTAGMERSKVEIKRDLEYLLRLWDDIREQTLQSTAPALIYEEANLVKRAIRDMYSRDVGEVQVEGEDAYRAAKDFMRMLMPSHAKKVQPYRDPVIPLFFRYQVESQLDAIHSPVVHLKSGGYIVINQTEALVAIDVNSGKATKERNIEETALRTNLEAADEVARQLRLRDLAGLVVIDFIDMEDAKNNAAVERRLKEAMKNDRARIQLGRISVFGLLELSRQRLRPSLVETNFEVCAHCLGTGSVRSVESTALYVLRAIEEEGTRLRSTEIAVHVPTKIALFILNQKRTTLAEIEQKYGFRVLILGDDTLVAPNFRLDRIRARQPGEELPIVHRKIEFGAGDMEEPEEPDEIEEIEAEEEEEETVAETARAEGEEGGRRRRRRRSRRRRGDERPEAAAAGEAAEAISEEAAEGVEPEESEEGDEAETAEAGTAETEAQRKRRRRGKRGGRRRSRPRLPGEHPTDEELPETADAETAEPFEGAPAEISSASGVTEPTAEAPSAEEAVEPAEGAEAAKPRRRRRPAAKKTAEAPSVEAAAEPEAEAPAEAAKPRRRTRRKPEPAVEVIEAQGTPEGGAAAEEPENEPGPAPDETEPQERSMAESAERVNEPPERPKRGWWRRLVS